MSAPTGAAGVVYHWLLENGPAISADVSKATGLGLSQTANALTHLRARGVVSRHGMVFSELSKRKVVRWGVVIDSGHDAPTKKGETQIESIRLWLKENEPATERQISNALNMARGSTRSALHKLIASGRVHSEKVPGIRIRYSVTKQREVLDVTLDRIRACGGGAFGFMAQQLESATASKYGCNK